jgi:hypothetical protein
MSFEQERKNLEQALKGTLTPRWLSTVLAAVFYGFLLVRYDLTDQVLGLNTGQFG